MTTDLAAQKETRGGTMSQRQADTSMADNRITKARIRNHWQYGWWKYLLMVVLVIMSVSIGFSVTAYRPPEDRRIEVYLCHGWANAEQFQADLWPALLEAAPDQEELTVMIIDITGDDVYANMQFSTYTAAQQGDLCLLPRSEVKKLAEDEAWSAFIDLTPYIESGRIDLGDVSYAGLTFPAEDGGEGIFGLPADTLYGLTQYGMDPADSALVIMSFSGNEENVVKLLEIMIDRFATEKPEEYDAWHEQRKAGKSGDTQIFK